MANGGPLNKYGLTPKQEEFCAAFVRSGGVKTKSAIAAGYPESSARSRAFDCLQSPRVQARIETLCREFMSECAPAAIRSLADLAVNAASETVRQAASSSLLDRTGYRVPLVLEIDDHRSQADVDRELSILLGLDPASLSAAPEDEQGEGDALVPLKH